MFTLTIAVYETAMNITYIFSLRSWNESFKNMHNMSPWDYYRKKLRVLPWEKISAVPKPSNKTMNHQISIAIDWLCAATAETHLLNYTIVVANSTIVAVVRIEQPTALNRLWLKPGYWSRPRYGISGRRKSLKTRIAYHDWELGNLVSLSWRTILLAQNYGRNCSTDSPWNNNWALWRIFSDGTQMRVRAVLTMRHKVKLVQTLR